MKFVEFELTSGKSIFVNPAMISHVSDDIDCGISTIRLHMHTIQVKGKPEEICAKIQAETESGYISLNSMAEDAELYWKWKDEQSDAGSTAD